MSVITFQNLVPVALYLTVEGVKTIQACISDDEDNCHVRL